MTAEAPRINVPFLVCKSLMNQRNRPFDASASRVMLTCFPEIMRSCGIFRSPSVRPMMNVSPRSRIHSPSLLPSSTTQRVAIGGRITGRNGVASGNGGGPADAGGVERSCCVTGRAGAPIAARMSSTDSSRVPSYGSSSPRSFQEKFSGIDVSSDLRADAQLIYMAGRSTYKRKARDGFALVAGLARIQCIAIASEAEFGRIQLRARRRIEQIDLAAAGATDRLAADVRRQVHFVAAVWTDDRRVSLGQRWRRRACRTTG